MLMSLLLDSELAVAEKRKAAQSMLNKIDAEEASLVAPGIPPIKTRMQKVLMSEVASLVLGRNVQCLD